MNVEQFAVLLVRSGLSNETEVEELIAKYQAQCSQYCTTDTVDTFCNFLVATHLFTEWQCEKLRMGKWKGFYLDNYLMLEQISKDDEHSYYKARDTRSGNLVRLTVTPYAVNSKIEYHVDSLSE